MGGVSVLVPFAGDRRYADVWRVVRRRLEADGWGDIIVEGDQTDEAFSKGRCIDRAARRASGDVLVIHDADSFVLNLGAAVRLIEDGAPWVMPFNVVQRLTPKATAAFATGAVDDHELGGGVLHSDRVAVPGGGVVVLSRSAYDAVGGIDPRFRGWGGEVDSFGWALDTLVGEHHQLDGPLWHLYHPTGLRRRGRRPLNECLAGAYREAHEASDVARMRRLVTRQEGCAA